MAIKDAAIALSEHKKMLGNRARWLRIAFVAGAATDGVALLTMLSPPLARFLWGLDDMPANFWFAMNYGAALMLGWTGLLVWAAVKPIERSFVAVLTALVIASLAVAEAKAAMSGVIEVGRLVPTFVLQTILFLLFVIAYCGSSK
jgi:hypothetical protein